MSKANKRGKGGGNSKESKRRPRSRRDEAADWSNERPGEGQRSRRAGTPISVGQRGAQSRSSGGPKGRSSVRSKSGFGKK